MPAMIKGQREKYRKSKQILWDKWDVNSHYRSEENYNTKGKILVKWIPPIGKIAFHLLFMSSYQ